jgi:hypothetical protein
MNKPKKMTIVFTSKEERQVWYNDFSVNTERILDRKNKTRGLV